mgnify:CR=1 FL=1
MTQKILLISGSGSDNSHSATNAEHLISLFALQGFDCHHWNLFEQPLPFLPGDQHREIEKSSHPIISDFIGLAKTADAYVWCTPNYHNSYSGILKNAIDLLAKRFVQRKPILLVSNGGGNQGAQPCDQLRIVARGLHGVAIPTQVITQSEDFDNTSQKRSLRCPNLLDRMEKAADELAWFTQALG